MGGSGDGLLPSPEAIYAPGVLRLRRRWITLLVPVLMIVFGAACGGTVITPVPSPTPSPLSTLSPITLPAPRTTAAIRVVPVATATPTVTPTPIIYIVQEGDVLGAIAYKYGVSVEALQQVNQLANPQFLRIGQQLIIPPKEQYDLPSSGLMPTPTPLPVGVRGLGVYETPAGSLLCLGELLNTNPAPIMNIQVRVTLLDAAGQKLGELPALVASDIILPAESSPFSALFTVPPTGWAGPAVTVLRAETVNALAEMYVPIAVVEAQGRPSEAQFLVEGVVQNASSDRSATDINVIVTTYDAHGQVTGFRMAGVVLDEPLGPGATAPFMVELTCFGGEPADFNIVAAGRAWNE